MSLRDDLTQMIRLQVGASEMGQEAVYNAPAGEKAWGSQQQAIDLLTSYCRGLEMAVLRLADEVEDLKLSFGESG